MIQSLCRAMNLVALGYLLFASGIPNAQEMPNSEILERSLSAENSGYVRCLRTLQVTLRGEMDDPQQRYELYAGTANLPDEPRLDHWFVDFGGRRLREYYRRLHLGEHDLVFENLVNGDETLGILTDTRRYQVLPRSFDAAIVAHYALPGFAILRALQEAESAPEVAGRVLTADSGEYRVSFTGGDGISRRLAIDAETFLARTLEWESPDPITGTRTNRIEYLGRSMVAGHLVPKQVVTLNHGRRALVQTVERIKVNQEIPESVFRIDPDLVLIPKEAMDLRLEWLGEGVGRVIGPVWELYALNFAVLDDGILVYDAPYPGAVQEAALTMISEATGGLPIKYLVVSHHHADHVRGISAYWKKGTTIITSRQSLPMLLAAQYQQTPEAVLANGVNLEEQPPEIILLEAGEVLDLGIAGAGVKIHNLGPTPHVNDLLTIYLPTTNMVLQADGYFLFSRFNSIFEFVLSWAARTYGNPTIVGVHTVVAPVEELLKRRDTQTTFVPKYLEEAGVDPN